MRLQQLDDGGGSIDVGEKHVDLELVKGLVFKSLMQQAWMVNLVGRIGVNDVYYVLGAIYPVPGGRNCYVEATLHPAFLSELTSDHFARSFVFRIFIPN